MAKCDPKSKITFNNFYKTKICPWFRKGVCRWGVHCNYAHSEDEQRGAVDLTKTALCPHIEKQGHCGSTHCRYAHTHEELRATTDVYKTSMCSYYLRDRYCPMGKKCRYAHGVQELRQKPSLEANPFSTALLSQSERKLQPSLIQSQCTVPQTGTTQGAAHANDNAMAHLMISPPQSPSPNGSIETTIKQYQPGHNRLHCGGARIDCASGFNDSSTVSSLQCFPKASLSDSFNGGNSWGMGMNETFESQECEINADKAVIKKGIKYNSPCLTFFDGSAQQSHSNANNFMKSSLWCYQNEGVTQDCSLALSADLTLSSPIGYSCNYAASNLSDYSLNFGSPLWGTFGRDHAASYKPTDKHFVDSLSYFKNRDSFLNPNTYAEADIHSIKTQSGERIAADCDAAVTSMNNFSSLLKICNDTVRMTELIDGPLPATRRCEAASIKCVEPLSMNSDSYGNFILTSSLENPRIWNAPWIENSSSLSHIAAEDNIMESTTSEAELTLHSVGNASDNINCAAQKVSNHCDPIVSSKQLSKECRISGAGTLGSRKTLSLSDNTSTTITTSSDQDSQLTTQTNSGITQTLLHEFLSTDDTQNSFTSTCTSPKSGKPSSRCEYKEANNAHPLIESENYVTTEQIDYNTDFACHGICNSKLTNGYIESASTWDNQQFPSSINAGSTKNNKGYDDGQWDMLVPLFSGKNCHNESSSLKEPMLADEMQECLDSIYTLISQETTGNDQISTSDNLDVDSGSNLMNYGKAFVSLKKSTKCGESSIHSHSSGYNNDEVDDSNTLVQRMVHLETERHSLLQENERLREYLKKLIGI
ncbi:zinc finger (CCCH type) motif-containing protein [Cardiosporidium cionae]|uniref:Zinc finger (CCCH type) motif-containing protein n=1 Tax=Cardiosporidium cionae TaxID=476202 RepID=A0ABQ7JDT1_9APIC|nr:zinc finger (CCCH type) motif-containing protein [Cardiosporidium cionae]|eukprot:KAF8822172.1 zinc finger (CCCH type) motif-containing protein [Cardiosporidium cionae]